MIEKLLSTAMVILVTIGSFVMLVSLLLVLLGIVDWINRKRER